MTNILLSRDQFREAVFKRDSHKCVFCDNKALDAHHILERRLWTDGGYYINNGISVCEEHHIACEMTTISVEQAREAGKILKKIIPEHLYDDIVYDKWGNIVLENGQRLRGELFYDESVQKILVKGEVLGLFTDKVKYPRTYHLPWSDNITDDDRVVKNLNYFNNKNVVVTVKMDGENTTMYNDYIHARSIDGRSHESGDWVKNFHNQIAHDIPNGWRVCGENLYAVHSIKYNDLPSYFLGFSIWNEKNECLSWESTLEWFNLLNIIPVDILYNGPFNENKIKGLYTTKSRNSSEGYVMRIADQFTYGQFKNSVVKYVRKDHVNTIKHWMYGQKIEKNSLKCQ